MSNGGDTADRRVHPETQEVLSRLQPGQRIRITQTVRVGFKEWTATVEGTYREKSHLVTGLGTHRRPEDDIIVPLVRFTKPNGELSSVSLDEHSKIEVLS
jgi:hypothetical protein